MRIQRKFIPQKETGMKKLRMGVLSTGNIAATMAQTLGCMEDVELYAVASRSQEKADVFAARFGFEKAYGTYEEMAADGKVDLVYVATPISEHCANVKILLENGRNVLCEKAFSVNAQEAREMTVLAKEKGLLLAEAMWVRYMPMAETLQEVIASGAIGKPYTLTANLGYLLESVHRMMVPELAGGALLDVGVYTLTFASIAFGDDISSIDTSVVMTDTGVDAQSSITLCYPDGRMSVLNNSLRALSDRQGIIYGTKGFLVVENINNFESITVYNEKREVTARYDQPKQISGYEYEVRACKKAIEEGLCECPQMSHSQTVRIMEQMDAVRKKWGLCYPMEK